MKQAIKNVGRLFLICNYFKADACDVTLSVYPHRAGLKNMPGHGGNRTYDLWNANIKNITYSNRPDRVAQLAEY